MEKNYVTWPLKEKVSNKKKYYVKCCCSVCGKQTADRTVFQMERTKEVICKSCSLKRKASQALETRKQTCLKRYGVENVFQLQEVKEKISEKVDRKLIAEKTHLAALNRSDEERKEIRDKIENSLIRNYGSLDNYFAERAKKTQATCESRYGVKSSLLLPQCKEHLKEKYNVEENISQSEHWKKAVEKTSMSKRGVHWHSADKAVIDKIQSTNLKKYGKKYFINTDAFRRQLYERWTKNSLINSDLSYYNLEYVNDTTLRCKKCGYERKVSHTFEVNMSFCPNCHSNMRSKYENLIAAHLEQNGIRFTTNDRSVIKPKELDVYIPDYKLAVEVDGLYFHQNKDKYYHVNKTKECEKLGIHLIHFSDKDLIQSKDKCLSIIDYFTEKNLSKIFARKCEVKTVENSAYRKFCEDNHLQGSAHASVKLGLYYNNELVQVMSFGKPRFSRYEWEIIRECSLKNYVIVGGKNKLFSYFVKNHNPESIVSYCDRLVFQGDSYLKMGMNLIKETQPSYVYYKDGGVLSRFQCQKHRLSRFLSSYSPDMSERDNMINNGYGVVYDCGERVFLWQRK